MLTLFISFTNSSVVTWPHPKAPQNPQFPALSAPGTPAVGTASVGRALGSGQGARMCSALGQASVSRAGPRGASRLGCGQSSPAHGLWFPLLFSLVLFPARLFQAPFSTTSASSLETPSACPPPCTHSGAPSGTGLGLVRLLKVGVGGMARG